MLVAEHDWGATSGTSGQVMGWEGRASERGATGQLGRGSWLSWGDRGARV
jgi:hypothetical protein